MLLHSMRNKVSLISVICTSTQGCDLCCLVYLKTVQALTFTYLGDSKPLVFNEQMLLAVRTVKQLDFFELFLSLLEQF